MRQHIGGRQTAFLTAHHASLTFHPVCLQVIQVLFAVLIGSMSLGSVAPNLSQIARAQSAAYRIFDLLDRQPSVNADPSLDVGRKPASITGRIEVKGVTFA